MVPGLGLLDHTVTGFSLLLAGAGEAASLERDSEACGASRGAAGGMGGASSRLRCGSAGLDSGRASWLADSEAGLEPPDSGDAGCESNDRSWPSSRESSLDPPGPMAPGASSPPRPPRPRRRRPPRRERLLRSPRAFGSVAPSAGRSMPSVFSWPCGCASRCRSGRGWFCCCGGLGCCAGAAAG
jgi:hypothetical protein